MVEVEERVTMHVEYERVLDYFLLRKVMRAGVEADLGVLASARLWWGR